MSTITDDDGHSPTGPNPVVAFIIGLAIILLSSILNAAGLNLTKLDHVRTSVIPKSERRTDWMRPLWLLGMILYILSQLIGSTLALEYMRAEYVAPLGSSSLIFNFLFARFLVGTPVTNNDLYGTIVVIIGVVGIVAFGSINSGLTNETDVAYITYLWRRGGWLGFFFTMSFALFCLLIFSYRLDAVLMARADLAAVPFSAARPPPANLNSGLGVGRRSTGVWSRVVKFFGAIKYAWEFLISWVTDRLEQWSFSKDDKQLAWTLGIGWACCGGGLAGLCLVFAKAIVKLLSGSLSHENPGNQFGHAAPIFTILLLALTAVLQIICLNRGLKVYDSTLVVPVFYGLYTATGFLDSLIFNDQVKVYQSWTLFLIFVSMLVLISGVVLLTHKKPEPLTNKVKSNNPVSARRRSTRPQKRVDDPENGDVGDDDDGDERGEGEGDVLWAVGDVSDGEEDPNEGDEDIDHHQHPLHSALPTGRSLGVGTSQQRRGSGGRIGEGAGLMDDQRRSMDPFRDDDDAMEEISPPAPLSNSTKRPSR